MVLQTGQNQVQILPVHTALFTLNRGFNGVCERPELLWHQDKGERFHIYGCLSLSSMNVQYLMLILPFTVFNWVYVKKQELITCCIIYFTQQGGCRDQLCCHAQKTHLIADTERHLGNLDIDEGVVHGSSLLHLIDVINRMLEERNCKMRLYVCFFLTSEHNRSISQIPLEVSWRTFWPLRCGSDPGRRLCWGPWRPWCPLTTAEAWQGYL